MVLCKCSIKSINKQISNLHASLSKIIGHNVWVLFGCVLFFLLKTYLCSVYLLQEIPQADQKYACVKKRHWLLRNNGIIEGWTCGFNSALQVFVHSPDTKPKLYPNAPMSTEHTIRRLNLDQYTSLSGFEWLSSAEIWLISELAILWQSCQAELHFPPVLAFCLI